MLVYILSRPDDARLVLTANRELMMATRRAAKDAKETLEINTWDTEASPVLAINLDFQMPATELLPSEEASRT